MSLVVREMWATPSEREVANEKGNVRRAETGPNDAGKRYSTPSDTRARACQPPTTMILQREACSAFQKLLRIFTRRQSESRARINRVAEINTVIRARVSPSSSSSSTAPGLSVYALILLAR